MGGFVAKPADMIYAVDDVPPMRHLVPLGLQHAALLIVYLVLIVVVVRTGGATDSQLISAVSLGMVAAAIGAMLQALRRGPVGSGFLASPVFSAIYLGPSLLAAKSYGLAAVFGMTIFAGVVEILFSSVLLRLRMLFPPAISGFIVMIVGVQLGLVGVDQLLDTSAIGDAQFNSHVAVSGLTLAIIVGLSVWAGGIARLMCTAIGIVIGFFLSIGFGLISPEALAKALSGPVLFTPDVSYISYSFEWPLLPAFLTAAIAAALRTVGVITTCQKINDDAWKRPDLTPIKKGILADGIGCVIAGLMGCIGQNTAPSLVGVSKATGATSRSIAFMAGIMLIIFAFTPVIGSLLLLLPRSVIGAALVFTASFMITGGIQIMVTRNIDTRMTFVIGIATLLGLSREMHPTFYQKMPWYLQPFTSTTMAISVTAALVLHLLFRIGAKRTASITISTDGALRSVDGIVELLREKGATWNLPPDLLERSVGTLRQILHHMHETHLVERDLTATLAYNDIDLVIGINYIGTLLSLPNVGVKHTIFLEEESFSYGLADFLTNVYPDRMESLAKGNEVSLKLVFSS